MSRLVTGEEQRLANEDGRPANAREGLLYRVTGELGALQEIHQVRLASPETAIKVSLVQMSC